MIIFSNGRNYVLPLPLGLFGIELTLDANHLDVFWDRKRSFINHITRKFVTALKSMDLHCNGKICSLLCLLNFIVTQSLIQVYHV